MSTRTLKMSLGFIAVVALAAGAVLVPAGNASADIHFNNVWYSTDQTVGTNSSGYEISVQAPRILTQNAYTVSATDLLMRDNTGTSTYNLGGTGSLTLTGNAYIGDSSTSAVMNVSGTASFAFAHSCYLGDGGSGTLDISGSATVTFTGTQFQLYSTSYMNVTGGSATINIQNIGSSPIGGFVFTLDNNGTKISPINVTAGNWDLSNSGNVGKIDIVTSGFTPIKNSTYDLITVPTANTIWVPGSINTLLKTDQERIDWSLSVVENTGGKDILRLTALTPEPATMALLAIGGLGMLIRRRRHG